MAGNNIHPPGPGHETRDVNVSGVVGSGIGLAFLIVAALVLVWFVFEAFRGPSPRQPAARRQPPEPRLQAAPRADLRQVLAEERLATDSYGWVNRGAGIARIPVDVAIDILAGRGLPAEPVAPPPAGVSVPTESGLGPAVQREGGPLALQQGSTK